jgi:subtilisin family serine protease
MPVRKASRNASALASSATSLIGVNYDLRTATARKTVLGSRETALGGTLVRQFTFPHANILTHVLKVPTSKVPSVEAALRAQPGVKAVGLTGQRRYAASVNAPYFPNDPYFTGFKSPVPPTTGATAPPATYETGLDENASVPGQWDMHVTRLEYAFGYSQGSSVGPKSGALGSNTVKIAVIDTGEDATHPELKSKIAYQKCFITNADGTAQSTSNYTTDPDGHGTDVSGIAAADTNNSLGFTGAGGNVELYAYRVFPTPDDSCVSDTSTDAQCGSDTNDIAAAIDDAVTQKVNVISMSLGGGQCNSDGSDADPTEGAAVEEALAANIIVVAAAGNSSGPPTESPGCDNYGSVGSVLAVGATALSDGTTNGSSNTVGSASAPQEYVASYTDYGSPGAAVNSSSAWGIVAPGGDPSGDSDGDDLHWIENIWTSAPFDSNFAGTCSGDYPSESGTTDCRVLIAGTSMATPHVAGAAALILSVNSAYQSPAHMRDLLCSTADDIGDANEGCGRLDVYRAMASALGDAAAPGPSPVP